MDKEQSKLIHMDWWGKCRSCRFWGGSDKNNGPRGDIIYRWNPGLCTNEKSDMYQRETWTEGHCPKWDSFDIDTALELMQEDLDRFGK
jgi:hypothetical protein